MSSKAQTAVISTQYRDPIQHSLVYQIPITIFFALMLDGGYARELCAITMIGYWTAATMMMLRRRYNPSKTDLLFLRWGFVPLLLLGGVAAKIKMMFH